MAGAVAARGSRVDSAYLERFRSTLVISKVVDGWAKPRRANGVGGWSKRAWSASELGGKVVDRGEKEKGR